MKSPIVEQCAWPNLRRSPSLVFTLQRHFQSTSRLDMTEQIRENGMLTLTIDNATQYFKTSHGVGGIIRTHAVSICGFEWDMYANVMTKDGVAWLLLVIASSSDQVVHSSCKATCVFRIRSSSPDDFIGKRCITFTFAFLEEILIPIKVCFLYFLFSC